MAKIPFAGQMGIAEITGGSPYGASTIVGGQGATKQLVKMLHKDDIFSLTMFDDEVTRLIPPVRICDAHNLTRTIDAIHSGGSTFLSGGFKQGCLFATENLNKDLITRVMLLTDGQTNVGELGPAGMPIQSAGAGGVKGTIEVSILQSGFRATNGC